MKNLIGLIFLLSLFFSCTPHKIVTKNMQRIAVNELSIQWRYNENVNPIYQPAIDSVMETIIEKFNRKYHSFTIHKKLEGEDAGMTIIFDKGKFVSNAELASSYMITAVGAIATPLYIYQITEGHNFLAFWYFPHDKISYTAYFSPNVVTDKTPYYYGKISSEAVFVGKRKRVKTICNALKDILYRIIYNLDPKTEDTDGTKKKH